MSDFYCECESYSELYSAEWRKVRKPHRCYECRAKIEPGTRAYYTHGKCEGEWWSGYTCAKCQDVIEYVRAHVPCFCYVHGDAFGQQAEGLRESNIWLASMEANKTLPGFAFGVARRIIGIFGRSNL